VPPRAMRPLAQSKAAHGSVSGETQGTAGRGHGGRCRSRGRRMASGRMMSAASTSSSSVAIAAKPAGSDIPQWCQARAPARAAAIVRARCSASAGMVAIWSAGGRRRAGHVEAEPAPALERQVDGVKAADISELGEHVRDGPVELAGRRRPVFGVAGPSTATSSADARRTLSASGSVTLVEDEPGAWALRRLPGSPEAPAASGAGADDGPRFSLHLLGWAMSGACCSSYRAR
jgi:hypothetical protein